MSFQPPLLPLVPPLPSSLPPPLPPPPPEQRTGFPPPLPTNYAPPLHTGYAPPLPAGHAPPLPTGHPPLPTGDAPPLPPGHAPPLPTERAPPLRVDLAPPVPPSRTPTLPPTNHTPLLPGRNFPPLLPPNPPPLLLPGHTPPLHAHPTRNYAQGPYPLLETPLPALLPGDYRSLPPTHATRLINRTSYVDSADATPTGASSNNHYHGKDNEPYLPTQECTRWPGRDASKSSPAPGFSVEPNPYSQGYTEYQSHTAPFNLRPNMLNRDWVRQQSPSQFSEGAEEPRPLFAVGPEKILPHLRPCLRGETISSRGEAFAPDFQRKDPLEEEFPSEHDGPNLHEGSFPPRDAPRPLFGAPQMCEGQSSVPPPSFRHPPHDCPPPGMFDSPKDFHPPESQERPHLLPSGPHPFHIRSGYFPREPRFPFDQPCQPHEGPDLIRGSPQPPVFRALRPPLLGGRSPPPHHPDHYDHRPHFQSEQYNELPMARNAPPKPHLFINDDIPPLFPDHERAGVAGVETENQDFARNYPDEDYGYEDDYGPENSRSYAASEFAGDEDHFNVNLQHDQYHRQDQHDQHDQHDRYHQHDQHGRLSELGQYDRHSQHDQYAQLDQRGPPDQRDYPDQRLHPDQHIQSDQCRQPDDQRGTHDQRIQPDQRNQSDQCIPPDQRIQRDRRIESDRCVQPDQREDRKQKAAFAAGRENASANDGWDGHSYTLRDDDGRLLRTSNLNDCSSHPEDVDRYSDCSNLTSNFFREGVQRYLSEKALLDQRDQHYRDDLRDYEEEPHHHGDGPRRYHSESHHHDDSPDYRANDGQYCEDERKRFRREDESDLCHDELFRRRDLSRQRPHSEYRELQPYREQDDHTQPLAVSRSEVPTMEVPMPLPETRAVSADQIFDSPGRSDRPSHIVVILRGLPGSGKSHIAKLIKDKETSNGGHPPRILALDTYFVNEVEKVEKDPITGRRVKRKVEEYEYDAAMEPSFRKSMFKIFNKTLEEGFFPMIIVDAINHKIRHFDRFWSSAKMKGFEVYVADVVEEVGLCTKRNTHRWSRAELDVLAGEWEDTPVHFLRLDVVPLLSDSSNIPEIEMEGTNEVEKAVEQEEETAADSPNQTDVAKSRWEDASDDKLDKLDAVRGFRKRKRLLSDEEEREELSLTEYLLRKMEEEQGARKKRVRWADLEAIKEAEEIKKMGFVMGSRWTKPSEEETHKLLMGSTEDQS